MSKRAPETIIAKLRELVRKCETGPTSESDSDNCLRNGRSDEQVKGFREACSHHRSWRRSWITPELRQILAWMDGAATAHEIEAFSSGYDYGKDKP